MSCSNEFLSVLDPIGLKISGICSTFQLCSQKIATLSVSQKKSKFWFWFKKSALPSKMLLNFVQKTIIFWKNFHFWKVEQILEIMSPIASKSDKNSHFYEQMKIERFSSILTKISKKNSKNQKNFKISKMTKLQMALSQRVFNIFRHLKKLVNAEMFYFSKKEHLCLLLMSANN